MPETTENYHRVPVANKKKGNQLRTINIGKGIKALYDPKRKVIVTYLFDVDQYTMKQAKEWVKKHKDSADYGQSAHNQYLVEVLRQDREFIVSDVEKRLVGNDVSNGGESGST